jgi:hypothetical protein
MASLMETLNDFSDRNPERNHVKLQSLIAGNSE